VSIAVVAAPFFATTAVTPVGPDRYRANIDPAWNLRPLPQGGIATAIAVRAMAQTLGEPSQTLRGLHTVFAAQVRDGEVDIAVEVLRRGRSISQLRAEVTSPGADRGHLTTAIFGGERPGFDFTDLQPPADVGPPDAYPSFRDAVPDEAQQYVVQMPFWAERVEGRPAIGHAPWEEYVPDRAERAFWYRFDEPPLRADGSLDPLALVVLADTMPGAVSERVGRTGPLERTWFAPSIDLTVHLLDVCRSPWVLAHNRARFAGHGYASADMALWDCGADGIGTPRLVAYATQLFLFSFNA
jgi:acyl-CoA thioesterase